MFGKVFCDLGCDSALPYGLGGYTSRVTLGFAVVVYLRALHVFR